MPISLFFKKEMSRSSSIVAFSLSSSPVVTSLLPAQANSTALPFPPTIVAPAPAGNMIILPGLSSYTGAQALSAHKRA
ncbi:uncharacterized protein CIMG_12716 [Coccidioides immitis RS]|uniref:Uncharacterized protein n=1 Tax=Coccidioides immitis (strain RS) TaxID=246410 RepID=A0A0D8JRT6_COCIM|nr:uncharacterized protein CIMG_12716 [Coccidioides immitis RS]KJF60065.1 hypothetical protein CIMG_12716 [Coccidioides immitis RS]